MANSYYWLAKRNIVSCMWSVIPTCYFYVVYYVFQERDV